MRGSELKRKSQLKRGSGGLARRPLKQKPKKRLPPEARVFKNWWMGQPCAGCRLMPAEVTHHIVLEQYLSGPDKWCLDNAMALCRACHNAHHSPHGPRVRRVDIPDRALEFASRVLGGRAGSYFARRYA